MIARTSCKYISQSPNRIKVLSRSGIKREGHIKSVYRCYYDRNWVLMSVSGARKDLKSSQLHRKESLERSYLDWD